MNNFWCITTFFNPAGYKTIVKNYEVFVDSLLQQNVNLLTVELAFNDEPFQLDHIKYGTKLKVRSNSIMWQKERLINYGLSQLPSECDKFAWLDCDILFSNPNWVKLAVDKLQTADIIQLYKKVTHLPKNDADKLGYTGEYISFHKKSKLIIQGIVWQEKIHKNWLERRINKELPFSTPGFAWAAKRKVFDDIGIYDRNIIGSGDTLLVDCLLNSWGIHSFATKFNDNMKKDIKVWKTQLDKKKVKIDYIPVDIYHLYHGNLRNRNYTDRHDILRKYNYNPDQDIKLVNNVYEWNSDKKDMHDDIKQYFLNRKEDE